MKLTIWKRCIMSSTSTLTFSMSVVLLFANARNKAFQYDNFKEANDGEGVI